MNGDTGHSLAQEGNENELELRLLPVSLVTDRTGLLRLEEEWRRLAGRSLQATVFQNLRQQAAARPQTLQCCILCRLTHMLLSAC